MVSAPSAEQSTSTFPSEQLSSIRWIHANCTLQSDAESTDSRTAPYFSTHLNVGAGGVLVTELVAVLVCDVVREDVAVVVALVVADEVAVVVRLLVCVVVALDVADVVALDVPVEVTLEVTVDVGVVVAEVVCDDVGLDVMVVVGVVTSQSRKPPCIHDSVNRFKVAMVASQSVGSYRSVPKAHATSSSALLLRGGPRNSRRSVLIARAVAAQSLPLSTNTACPAALDSHSNSTSRSPQ